MMTGHNDGLDVPGARENTVAKLRQYADQIENGEDINVIACFGVVDEAQRLRMFSLDYGQPHVREWLTWSLFKHNLFMTFRGISLEFPKPQ